MYNFRFFDDHELTGKTPLELHRMTLIDKAMRNGFEYDDLERLNIEQIESFTVPKPKPPKPAPKPKAPKVGQPRRIIPMDIAEAFEYRRGAVYRLEYLEHMGEIAPVPSPYPVEGTMRAQGLVVKWRREYLALHRLVWFLVKGEWPDGRLIHLDGDKANNRIENLELERLVIIRKTKAGYLTKVRQDGCLIELGVFDTHNEAAHSVNVFKEHGTID